MSINFSNYPRMMAVIPRKTVRTRCAAIVNHSAVVKALRGVNLLRVVFSVRRGPLGNSGGIPECKCLKIESVSVTC